jgi:hypothetical protein
MTRKQQQDADVAAVLDFVRNTKTSRDRRREQYLKQPPPNGYADTLVRANELRISQGEIVYTNGVPDPYATALKRRSG